MPITKELTIRIGNRPGSLATICRVLADRGVNIMAFQSIPSESTILVCIVADKPAMAESVFETEGIAYTEAEVAQVKLPHKLGELARAASKLGEANINIHYAYCGVEPDTNSPLMIFGVTEVGRAAEILDRTAVAAAGTYPKKTARPAAFPDWTKNAPSRFPDLLETLVVESKGGVIGVEGREPKAGALPGCATLRPVNLSFYRYIGTCT